MIPPHRIIFWFNSLTVLGLALVHLGASVMSSTRRTEDTYLLTQQPGPIRRIRPFEVSPFINFGVEGQLRK